MDKRILAIILIAVIFIALGFVFIINQRTPPTTQNRIDKYTENYYMKFMKEQNFTILESSECSLKQPFLWVEMEEFPVFVYCAKEEAVNKSNPIVYLEWLNITNEIKIPRFFYFYRTSKNSYTPELGLKSSDKNAETDIQEKIIAQTQTFLEKLESLECEIQSTSNDSDFIFPAKFWIECNKEDYFLPIASLRGRVYLYWANITETIRRPIFLVYFKYGIKLAYSLIN